MTMSETTFSWQIETIILAKEYIREELACYARNMSKDMKRKFNFVNIAGNAFTDIPDDTLHIIEND